MSVLLQVNEIVHITATIHIYSSLVTGCLCACKILIDKVTKLVLILISHLLHTTPTSYPPIIQWYCFYPTRVGVCVWRYGCVGGRGETTTVKLHIYTCTYSVCVCILLCISV